MSDQQEIERRIIDRVREINNLSNKFEALLISFRELTDVYTSWNDGTNIIDIDEDISIPCIRGSRNNRKFEIVLASRKLREPIDFTEIDGTTHSLIPKLINPGSTPPDEPIEAAPVRRNRTSYTFY